MTYIYEVETKTQKVLNCTRSVWMDGNMLVAMWSPCHKSTWCPNATHALLKGDMVSREVAEDGRQLTYVHLVKITKEA